MSKKVLITGVLGQDGANMAEYLLSLDDVHVYGMMRRSGSPNYHNIKVEMTDVTQFETKSTWGSEGDVLKLEIDPKSHSAWTGGKQKILDKGRVSKFNKKFQNFKSETKK